MSPLHISIMLWYYCHPTDYMRGTDEGNSVATCDFVQYFCENEMLCYNPQDGALYHITDKGMAYVESILDMPMPVQQWITPAIEKKSWRNNK
jgi:hypothetical protein